MGNLIQKEQINWLLNGTVYYRITTKYKGTFITFDYNGINNTVKIHKVGSKAYYINKHIPLVQFDNSFQEYHNDVDNSRFLV